MTELPGDGAHAERGSVDGPVLEWHDVRKDFVRDGRVVTAIEGIDLAIARGEFVSIVGPSGCGKSTILNMAAGIMKPTAGNVIYGGLPIDGPNTSVGYMTQSDALLPWRTVEGNVALPLEIRNVPRDERKNLVRQQLRRVGLQGFEGHYPHELSGGMRKRTALVRTLVYEPETLLMDEPFGALDAQLKAVMQEQLLQLWQGSGKTIVFVTHDLQEAITLSDRVVVLTRRPGKIKKIADVPLSRPREVMQIGLSPDAANLARELWAALREDMAEGEEV